jgi:ferritin
MIFDTLQAQMNKERQNAAQYDAFAAVLSAANWPGFAAWMQHAADDERVHYGKFRDYLIDRNQTPALTALEQPANKNGAQPIPLFEAALALEQENTASILAIDAEAETVDDCQTETWLIWAIEEQTRSERELTDALLELRRVDATGLLMLDREYGEGAAGG